MTVPSTIQDTNSNNQNQPTLDILVVDDQPITIESIRRLLVSQADIKVHGCTDPTMALSIAAEVKPSV
ncbi:MAG: hybrid sensor histidine kinase/response regulator, partial [Cyanobacteria bacterium J06648_10]